MRKKSLCLLPMVISIHLSAQFNDSFSDGDFMFNPVWNGNTADWQVIANSDVAGGVANSHTLRLNVAAGSGTTYLSAQVAGGWGAAQSWGYFVGRRGQAYTAANHTLIWLWASEANLTSPTVDGYRIRIGDDGGGDEIILQRVTDGSATDIITGNALANNLTDIGFLLRVSRSNSGNWEIFTSVLPVANGSGAIATDVANAANANISHGTIADNVYSNFDNGYIGFVNVHGSGTAARTSQEFDQIQLSFSGAAVPVKLLRFDAAEEGPVTRLTWDAAEESGLLGYEIQRSINGFHFTTIGLVEAANRTKYSFVDVQRLTENNFYRLRMVDADGNSRWSHIVSVKAKTRPAIEVSPNPAKQTIRIGYPKTSLAGTLQIMNSSGRVVQQIKTHANSVLVPVDISALPIGVYYLIFVSGDVQLFTTLIKQ